MLLSYVVHFVFSSISIRILLYPLNKAGHDTDPDLK